MTSLEGADDIDDVARDDGQLRRLRRIWCGVGGEWCGNGKKGRYREKKK